MGSDILQTDGLDYGRPCEDLGAYTWEFVMPHGWLSACGDSSCAPWCLLSPSDVKMALWGHSIKIQLALRSSVECHILMDIPKMKCINA